MGVFIYQSIGIIFFTFVLFFTGQSCHAFIFSKKPAPVLTWKKSESEILKQYEKLHSEFRSKLCGKAEDKKYYKLLSRYRGEGLYIPLIEDKLDRRTVLKYLPVLIEKEKWISGLIEQVKKRPFPALTPHRKKIESLIEKLLVDKRKIQLGSGNESVITHSKSSQQQLYKAWNGLLDDFYFLKSFRFPVDHFENRRDYDFTKVLSGNLHKAKSNDIYFFRKIVEDGAMNPNHSSSDVFLRSTMDTVELELRKKERPEMLSENLRYDLAYVLEQMDKFAQLGQKKQLLRLREWKERTANALNYYRRILKKSLKSGGKLNEISARNKASEDLQFFVGTQLAKTYQFWAEKKLLMRALWVIETILFNEVGRVDGARALDRKDVTQIVINRTKVPFYRQLDKDEKLFEFLTSQSIVPQASFEAAEIQKFHWLNTLFKKAEFSFTFYYIPSVRNVFCPDMSRAGRKLRAENLNIALSKLAHPDPTMKAMRYFSRASMTGRIDMSQIWNDYMAMAERKGEIIKDWRIRKKYQNVEKRQFLYQFKDPTGELLHVYRYRPTEELFVLDPERPRTGFFSYRNPHYFKYFSKTSMD